MGILPESLPEVDNLTLQDIFNHPVVQELAEKRWKDLESEVKLPYSIRNHVLMSPGTWNNFFYDATIIEQAYKDTEWSKTSRSLFWDHKDDQASEWVGEVDNLHTDGNGNLIGDVVVVDKSLAMKLAFGAKFGVSPKVIGESDYYRRVQDAHFENFSIVINPAVKTTFLNSQIKIREAVKMSDAKDASGTAAKLQESEIEEEETEETTSEEKMAEKKKPEELKKKKYEYPEEMSKKMSEIESKLSELATSINELKCKYPKEEAEKKKPEEEEMAEKKKPEEEEMTKHLSEYTDFVKSFLKKNPGKSVADAAKAWGKEHSESDERHRLTDYTENIPIVTEQVASTQPGNFASEMKEITNPVGPTPAYEVLPTDADLKMAEWLKQGLVGG